MSDQQPPPFATWVAERLVSGPRRESLLGDLLEQYRQNRSNTWYWRQVCAAIVLGTVHDLTAHKLLALRALVIGWTLYYLLSFPVFWGGRAAEKWLSQHITVCEPTSFWCQFWLNQFSAELLIYMAAAISGWMVARLHRTHWVAMLSLYAASVLLSECGMLAWLTSQSIRPVAVSPIAVIVAHLTVVVRPFSILLGGMWAIRSDFHRSYRPSTP